MLRTLRQTVSFVIPAFLLLLNLGVVLCYWNRWDEWVAITLVPMWAWAAFGTFLSGIVWPTCKSRFALFTFGLWLITGLALSDETAGLLREFRGALTDGNPALSLTENAPGAERLRVATVNCAEGMIEATANLEKMKPDLILLQEAPESQLLEDLAVRIYGTDAGSVRTQQCAIIGRGRLSIAYDDPATGSLVATFERAGGGETIDVINLHLPKAMVRTDLWRPSSWAELSERRRSNRRLLRSLVEALPQRIGAESQIAGGSFGSPPSDDIFRLLRNVGMTDSFRQSGYGWGNTYPSSMPMLRVDQIWASARFQPVRSETFSSPHSDHRHVVTDFRRVNPPDALAQVPRRSLQKRLEPIPGIL
jgi:hypothetical protein